MVGEVLVVLVLMPTCYVIIRNQRELNKLKKQLKRYEK